jgi:NTE family protein
VDLNTGQQVHINQGSVVDAVRATIAIPGIFAPLERDGQLLVDGGVLNNLPADVTRDMGADVVIAVDVTMTVEAAASVTEQRGRRARLSGALGSRAIWYRSLRVMMVEINRHRMEQARPQVYLRPPIPPSIGALTGFSRAAEVIAAGEQVAREALPRIQSLLAAPAALREEA